jgi:hypothetical protein
MSLGGTPQAKPVAKDAGRLKYADQIGLNFPSGWTEGQDFQVGGIFAAGDLVGVTRSDGSIRFGQIVGKAGVIGNKWEVCVETNREGAPQSSRAEDGAKLRKVLPAALTGVVAFGETPERAEPMADSVDGTQRVEASGFKTNFFQRLGSMSPAIGGAQRDRTVPLPPPKKAAPAPPPRTQIDPSELKPKEPPAKPAAAPPKAAAPAGGGFLGGLFGGGGAAPAKPAAPPAKKAPAPPAKPAARAPVAPPKKAAAPPPKKAPAPPAKPAAPAGATLYMFRTLFACMPRTFVAAILFVSADICSEMSRE